MSLEIDGTWKAGVWATTVWANGVWREGATVVAEVPRGGTSKRDKQVKKVRKREEEFYLPYRPPPFSAPKPVPIHIVYDDPGLKADAKAEIEVVYRRRKRRKQIAAIMSILLDE